jgi:hypothetical protein
MTDVHIEQEPDRILGRPLAAAGILIILGILVSGVVALLLARGHVGLAVGRAPLPAPPARFDDELFRGREARGEREQRLAREHLDSWGWIDRETGRIHVPIEVAIELYLGAQPAAEGAR